LPGIDPCINVLEDREVTNFFHAVLLTDINQGASSKANEKGLSTEERIGQKTRRVMRTSGLTRSSFVLPHGGAMRPLSTIEESNEEEGGWWPPEPRLSREVEKIKLEAVMAVLYKGARRSRGRPGMKRKKVKKTKSSDWNCWQCDRRGKNITMPREVAVKQTCPADAQEGKESKKKPRATAAVKAFEGHRLQLARLSSMTR